MGGLRALRSTHVIKYESSHDQDSTSEIIYSVFMICLRAVSCRVQAAPADWRESSNPTDRIRKKDRAPSFSADTITPT